MNFKKTFKRTLAVLICFMLVLTSFQFVASADANLSLDKTEYNLGDEIKVTAKGSGDQWVGLFNADDIPSENCGSYFWYYVAKDGYVSGETYVIQNQQVNANKGSLLPGEYKVCLFADEGYTIVETVKFTITGNVDATAGFTTDKTVYGLGEPIMVTALSFGKNWIGIYEKGTAVAQANPSIYWMYTSDSNGEPFELQQGFRGRKNYDYSDGNFAGLPAGEYDLVYCLNDDYMEYERKTITIKEIVLDDLKTDKTAYTEGENVLVTAGGVNGQKVAIYHKDDELDATPVYEYTLSNDSNNKEVAVSNLTYGAYKVVLFRNDGSVAGTVYFAVSKRPFDEVLTPEENVAQTGANGLLSTDKLQYKVGEPIMVATNVSEEQAANKAWVGIVPMGSVPTPGGTVASYWHYVNDEKFGAQNGTPFNIFLGNSDNEQYQGYTPVTTGYYDIILFANDGYEILDKVTIARYSPEDVEISLTMDKTTYTEGESIYVTASSPHYYAWVGIYRADVAPGPELAIYWYWVDYSNAIPKDVFNCAIAEGSAIGAGDYKAVLFNDDGYSAIADVVYFTVKPMDISNTTFDFSVNGQDVENGAYIEIKEGDQIIVKPFAEGDAIGYSWIGVYNAQLGADTDFSQLKSVNWQYITDCNGEDWDVTKDLKLGENTVVLFTNSGYSSIAKYVWIYVEREDVETKEVITEATCTEAGVIHYIYADGTEENVVIMPLGHNFVGDEKVEATPDSLGGVKKKCTRCGIEDVVDTYKFDISKAEITVSNCGKENNPEITVVYNGQTLEKDKHYIVELSGDANPRVARIIGTNTCGGIVEKTYEVIVRDLYDAEITVGNAIYTGKAVTPAVSVVYGGKTLVENVDYTLKYADNVTVGYGKVTVVGIGDYEGSVDKTFEIKTLAKLGISIKLSKTKFVYNGKAQKPKVTVKVKGKKMATDKYSVKFAAGSKKVGKYSVEITINGDYSGTIVKTYVINPKAPKLKGVKAGKKAVTVKWAKVAKEISGYQIAYSTKKNFKKSVVVKVTSKKAVTKTIKKLKANTKYFVRIRTFKKVGKTTFKSAWSKAKSIKTK